MILSELTWHESFCKWVHVANIVIIPLQDIINLDEHARMNTPSSKSGNWRWSLESFKELFKANKIPLKKLTLKYNR
jgi:4-alpha-glucanotransferase